MSSHVPARPDIIIVRGDEQDDVFNRSVSNPETPIFVKDYLEILGQPAKIIKGSKFYGPEAEWYLYTQSGKAFVTKNDQVLEVHVFSSMNENEYIDKYGDDLLR